MTADASLLAIEAAIHAALEAKTIKNGGVFTSVSRWTGKLPTPDKLAGETFSADPTAVLLFDRSTTRVDVSTINGLREDIETINFIVVVSTADQRGADVTFTVDNTTKGIAVLIDAAIAALNNLAILPVHSVLTVTITGTAGTTVSLGGVLRDEHDVAFRAHQALDALLNGSGNATISVRCMRAGSVGNLTVGTELTWSAALADRNDTAVVSGLTITGTDGLLRGKTVRYLGSSYLSTTSNPVTAVQLQFSCERRPAMNTNVVEDSDLPPLERISFDNNLALESFENAPDNPINQGRVDYDV